MRIVDETERIVLLVVPGIGALVIVLHAALQLLGAQPANPLVSGVAAAADRATLDVLTTVFPAQSELQTAALALAPWGIGGLVVVLIFRFIRAAVGQIQEGRKQRAAAAAPRRADAPGVSHPG